MNTINDNDYFVPGTIRLRQIFFWLVLLLIIDITIYLNLRNPLGSLIKKESNHINKAIKQFEHTGHQRRNKDRYILVNDVCEVNEPFLQKIPIEDKNEINYE